MKKSILTVLVLSLSFGLSTAWSDDELYSISPEEAARLQAERNAAYADDEVVAEEAGDTKKKNKKDNAKVECKDADGYATDCVKSNRLKNQALGVLHVGGGTSKSVVHDNGMEGSVNLGAGVFSRGGFAGVGLAINPNAEERIGRRETDDHLVTSEGELVEREDGECRVVDESGHEIRECRKKTRAVGAIQVTSLPVWRTARCDYDGEGNCWALTLGGYAETDFDNHYGQGSAQLRKMRELGNLLVSFGAGVTMARGGKTDLFGVGLGGGVGLRVGDRGSIVSDVNYAWDLSGGYKEALLAGSVAGHYDLGKYGTAIVKGSGEKFTSYDEENDPKRAGGRLEVGIAGSHDWFGGSAD